MQLQNLQNSQQQQSSQDVNSQNVNFNEIYPFINEMVDTFYTENINNLIEKSIEANSDKSIFMMFITMYFAIHLKLKDDQYKKTYIKQLMSEIINDPIKRVQCIEMFESKFHDIYNSSKIKL
jgi:hypothetical protein